jgi:hypothetical protein
MGGESTMTTDPAGRVALVDRLRSPANWLRQDHGKGWKDTVNRYDTAPFEAAAEIERLQAENADLKMSVIAFCAPWAVSHAQASGLPDMHLHPTHYDILERSGARMDGFTRFALAPAEGEKG